MKKRFSLLLCLVLFIAASVACGKSPSVAPTAEPTSDPLAGALSAYREILETAPALEGEHEELGDASFGHEENLAKFGAHYDMFALSDLNGDCVPELIALSVVNFRWTPISVYTYAAGKAVLLHDPLDAESPVTFAQNSSANGAYTLYICEAGHIHSLWQGETPVGCMTEDYAYILQGTSLIPVDCAVGKNEKSVSFSALAKANTPENRDAVWQ